MNLILGLVLFLMVVVVFFFITLSCKNKVMRKLTSVEEAQFEVPVKVKSNA